MTIRELREKYELSQAKLAKAIGASTSLIGAIENGKRNVTDKIAAAVKDVYGEVIETAAKAENVKAEAAEAVAKVEKKAKKTKAEASATAAKIEKKAKTTRTKVEKKAKEVEKKIEAAVKKPVIHIQSPMGGEISPDEILAKVGAVDDVYVRVDENKAYWVKGEETGSVDLW